MGACSKRDHIEKKSYVAEKPSEIKKGGGGGMTCRIISSEKELQQPEGIATNDGAGILGILSTRKTGGLT